MPPQNSTPLVECAPGVSPPRDVRHNEQGGLCELPAFQGDVLRSHAPNLRLDGSEPVSAWSGTRDTARWSAMITLRYTAR